MPIKDNLGMTDRAIAREVGHRIDQIRLEQNISNNGAGINHARTFLTNVYYT